MIRKLKYIFIVIGLFSLGFTYPISEHATPHEIAIIWSDKVSGDFSFIQNWDYLEGIYKDELGQLSCDGFCPPELDKMKDENGRIYKDSLVAFYQLLDTTHQFHSILSEAWTNEWAGTNFVTAISINADTTICYTHSNVATHSSLILTITKGKCIPTIVVNSIASSNEMIFKCKDGRIEIDRNLWNKGILKAKFEFVFDNEEHPGQPMFWNGRIYKKIEKR